MAGQHREKSPLGLMIPCGRRLSWFGGTMHEQNSDSGELRGPGAGDGLSRLAGELGVEALDHTAIAVRDLAAALPLYRDLLGGVPSGYERISDKGFMWLSLRYPNRSQVELI